MQFAQPLRLNSLFSLVDEWSLFKRMVLRNKEIIHEEGQKAYSKAAVLNWLPTNGIISFFAI